MTTKKMRDILVVRAGDSSLHPGWLRGPAPAFDLFVSYYGDAPGRYAGHTIPSLYEVAKGFKWPPLAALVRDRWDDVLARYEYVGFPDDDLAADAASWNGVFDAARRLDLCLCQPALTADSYANWAWLRRHPGLYARITRSVEIMTPVFRLDALAAVRDTFGLTRSGWGIDAEWARRLPHPRWRKGVIDRYPVRHTRPGQTGPLYDDYRRAGVDPGADSRCLSAGGEPASWRRVYEEVREEPPLAGGGAER